MATIQSIASSTRIEGSALTNAEVDALLSNLKIKNFATRDEQEVAGYAEAMALITESYEQIPVTESHIKQLHSILMQYSKKDQRHRGEYKKLNNHVEAFDAPEDIRKLIDWMQHAMVEKIVHPLIAIGAFIVCFLAIHPFQDGNGRLSRVLTNLLLLKAGYLYTPYTSLESVIEKNKESYCFNLRKTQGTLYQEGILWQPWIQFHLKCLYQQKKCLTK